MKSKYFTVEVKPTIPNVAAGQHAAFSDGDVLFNWHAFDIPRGPAKLLGVSCDLRPKGNADADPNKFAFELFFAKSRNDGTDPTALGTVNSAVTVPAFSPNQIMAFVEVVAGDFADHLDSTSFSHTVPLAGTIFSGEPKPEKGSHVGFDRYYVAGMAGAALDFTSLTRINNGDLNGPVLTVDGTDPRLFLNKGDTIAVTTTADTTAAKSMGVIKSVDSATQITLESAFTTGDVVNDDFVYNVSPITIRLHFEK
mgnify:CR=1 FL=1|tara:strand:+ start:413 stop:1171 length:759 start_codon:yes stop_codon:yes gene_type:complete